ncbi:MAG: metal-dependent transcriptional regulator [Candidatus Bathyarchaeota archaeon]|nr:metal-dependent transcriptional regulator [Candidatus Termiticorpusculum sp.]
MVDADRIDRLNATEETYVETIDVLMRKLGYAVVTDIAKKLDVKSPSVTSMLKRLDSLGFVKYTPYRNVNLTSKGKSLAVFLNRRHKSLQALLRLLGVDEVTAEKDACAIEHIVHASTLEKLEKFVDFVQNTPQGSVWLECFKNNELNGCELQNCPISSRATER